MSEIKFTTNGSGQMPKLSGKKTGVIVTVVAILIVVIIIAANCFTIVNEGFIGVRYRFGKIEQSNLTAGLNIHLPFIEEIQQVDTRNQIYEITADAYTSDTQTVKELRMKLTYIYDQSKLTEIIRETGISNVKDKLIVPNVNTISKNEIGKVKAEVLVQSRAEVEKAIGDELTRVLQPHGVLVIGFALENLAFDPMFEESIQAKVIAAQDALKMENKTKEREEEAKQVVIAAQAEADSVKIAAEAEALAIELIQEQLANSPNYIDYLKITNWNGVLPQVMSDGVNPFLVLDSTTQSGTSTTQSATQQQQSVPATE